MDENNNLYVDVVDDMKTIIKKKYMEKRDKFVGAIIASHKKINKLENEACENK